MQAPDGTRSQPDEGAATGIGRLAAMGWMAAIVRLAIVLCGCLYVSGLLVGGGEELFTWNRILVAILVLALYSFAACLEFIGERA